MARKRRALGLHEPLLHADHPRPVTRRDFLRAGMAASVGTVVGGGLLGLLASPRSAHAALSADIAALKAQCGIAAVGAGKIPFICIDLAGGANIAGSNVLIGDQSGDFSGISAAGYSKLGLPADMIPGVPEATPTATSNTDHTDTTLGLAFHSDSGFLRGILERTSPETQAFIDGAVIPARSDNDTGNNPHNPMYGIARCGADGQIVALVGSNSSDSGGNSMAPADLMNPEIRPTKVDRPSDVTGLVDTGNLTAVFPDPPDVVAVMEAMARVSQDKLGHVTTGVARDAAIKDLVRCGYVKAADLADRFAGVDLSPATDEALVGPNGIFTAQEFADNRDFQKAASVAKMVVDGYAGAGTITLGGYDYHTGERGTGERRDLLAGRVMGCCLEYAAARGVPIMLYVFSDGSVASNGRVDDTPEGRGKGEWTGDNSSTAASFFLVYNPNGQPTLRGSSRQIGWFRADASVETAATPAANNVNLLVQTVLLNYMALHGEENLFAEAGYFPNHGLGNATLRDSLVVFDRIVDGTLA
ncbi:MAG: general secretion pathway protein GspF [Gammaproteobacteria bacterium SG8_47]|nr:MAG: general secretion pathway protein GspF [Gammaproteobacteria bacterium SG8_47]